jgi:DNA invertase Pin-like site-specific DNA recombinase
MIAAWSVDRLGRSLKNLLDFIEELKAKNVDLTSSSSMDTSTPQGRMPVPDVRGLPRV